MRKVLSLLAVVLLSVSSTLASDDGNLVARSIQTYEQIEAIREQMRDATADLEAEKRAYELAIREANSGAKTEQQLKELRTELERHQQILIKAEKNNTPAASTDYSRKRVRDLSLMIEAGSLQTDVQRKAFKIKYQPKIDRLNKQIKRISTPYNKRISELQDAAQAESDALVGLLRPYLKTPGANYTGSRVDAVNADMSNAFGSSNWNDSDDHRIAWAHIRIRSQDEIEDYHRQNLLDGKYPIQSLSDGSIWVWAGNFLITFVADDEALKGKDNIQQAIHDFIDLEGLASIQIESTQVATGEQTN